VIPDDARFLLGTAPDPEVAQSLGVSVSTVHRWRVALDIAAWGRVNAYPRHGGVPGVPCPEEIHDLLGTLPDRVIAARASVSCTTIRKWRVAAKRPACRKHAQPRTQR
jgi:transposase